jgi:ferric-dicitrate binding protein FerR (iron transport regulator)
VTTMEPQDETSKIMDRLGVSVRDCVSGEIMLPLSMAGRDQLVVALAKPSREARGMTKRPTLLTRAVWGLTGLCAMTLTTALVLAAIRDRRAMSLEWTAENAEISPDGHIRAARPGGAALLGFSGGARLALAEGGQGRLVDHGARPARIVLEMGRASVSCEAFPHSSIVVEAGPYALTCRAAAFDVSWSNARLEVRAQSGMVTLKGPLGTEDVTVAEGQSFVVWALDRK